MESHMASLDNVGWNCRMALEGRHDGICDGNMGLHEGLVPSNRLWAIVYGRIYDLNLKEGHHDHLRTHAVNNPVVYSAFIGFMNSL
jgi:hypothetical protein